VSKSRHATPLTTFNLDTAFLQKTTVGRVHTTLLVLFDHGL
jgi:hypothetical protein